MIRQRLLYGRSQGGLIGGENQSVAERLDLVLDSLAGLRAWRRDGLLVWRDERWDGLNGPPPPRASLGRPRARLSVDYMTSVAPAVPAVESVWLS